MSALQCNLVMPSSSSWQPANMPGYTYFMPYYLACHIVWNNKKKWWLFFSLLTCHTQLAVNYSFAHPFCPFHWKLCSICLLLIICLSCQHTLSVTKSSFCHHSRRHLQCISFPPSIQFGFRRAANIYSFNQYYTTIKHDDQMTFLNNEQLLSIETYLQKQRKDQATR